ncbi:hypothetical protein LTR36_009017 [Oleoguttula mirabilis]|uniref:GET complex, subunit GET2 n=1 Tax=Oleoguttula mirabilis TaxID=1507867 RepID=A0AAV9J709_9PEZI|nr:hypothetical protein LTR36_009017 [Oleoguttula mirabilis]
MADTAPPTPADETPNQKQARLRREKRQKRMAEEGEDRLAKIKALNGGVAPPAEALGGPAAPTAPTAASSGGAKGAHATTVEDPDEADIDTVSGVNTPGGGNGGRMGMGMGGGGGGGMENPFAFMQQMQQQGGAGGQGGQGDEADPMMAMMQQLTGMMGGNPQNPNDPNQPPQIPPMLQAMMGMGGGAAAGGNNAQKAPVTGSAYLWRIVHALFAVSMALYITLTSTMAFTGSKLARSQAIYSDAAGPRLFTIFTTAELLLQGTRFFLEKGQLQGGGMLAMVANSGFVPEPYAQLIRTGGRWVGIGKSILSDAMVVVFVFGAVAWWGGRAAT